VPLLLLLQPALLGAGTIHQLSKTGARLWLVAGTNGERIHYTHDAGSMLPVHRDLIDRGECSWGGYKLI
jgi:hypothetical protein